MINASPVFIIEEHPGKVRLRRSIDFNIGSKRHTTYPTSIDFISAKGTGEIGILVDASMPSIEHFESAVRCQFSSYAYWYAFRELYSYVDLEHWNQDFVLASSGSLKLIFSGFDNEGHHSMQIKVETPDVPDRGYHQSGFTLDLGHGLRLKELVDGFKKLLGDPIDISQQTH